MTGTDLYVNKPHCTAAAQCGLFTHKSVPVIFEPPCTLTSNTVHTKQATVPLNRHYVTVKKLENIGRT